MIWEVWCLFSVGIWNKFLFLLLNKREVYRLLFGGVFLLGFFGGRRYSSRGLRWVGGFLILYK